MIEPGKTFIHEGQTWEVLMYYQYENKFISRNLNSHNFQKGKFTEKDILEGK